MYFKVQLLVTCNNHEFDVGMDGNVKFVETQDRNSEHMHVKWKFIITVMWNIMQEFKFHFYHPFTPDVCSLILQMFIPARH
jgi:hypothetical protein